MFFFTYRKERNDQNGNPRRFVTVWYLPAFGVPMKQVCQNVNEGYIGMHKTIMDEIVKFTKANPELNIDPAVYTLQQLHTGIKGG